MESKAMVLWKTQAKVTFVLFLEADIKRNSINGAEWQTHTTQNSAVFVCNFYILPKQIHS